MRALMLLLAVLTLFGSSCVLLALETDEPSAAQRQIDAESLLAQVREVLPEGWEARLYWSPNDAELRPKPAPVDWMEDKWRGWLPGIDGRQIVVRRKEAVEYMVDVPGPDPQVDYTMKEVEYPRFALTLGEARKPKEINLRLSELNDRIERLETLLKASRYQRQEDGYVQHSVPRGDESRRALLEYNQLWTIKRWFPQWSSGSLSVGFRSLAWIRMLPDEAKVEYRDVKKKVIDVLRPIPNWKHIPANEL